MLTDDLLELAGRIGPRHAEAPHALVAARDFLEARLRGLGWPVIREQAGPAINLIAELPGTTAATVLLGAHYDSVPGSPGADDNASGVAAVLELASRWSSRPRKPALRIALFDAEERMKWDRVEGGSWYHAHRHPHLQAAVILDSLGCYDDRPGSQSYPAPWMGLCWPRRGDFVAVQAHWRHRRLARQALAAFRASSPLPAHGFWLPRWRWQLCGDQESFVHAGVPTVAFTDLEHFRNPRWHKSNDIPASIDHVRLNTAVQGIDGVLEGMLR